MTPLDILRKSAATDRSFSQYLDGKTVAIVGRGPSANDDCGKHIDSHDVVVRVHRAIPLEHYDAPPEDGEIVKERAKWGKPEPFVPEAWQDKVGVKANIFYNSLGPHVPMSFFNSLIRGLHAAGGRFVSSDSPHNITRYVKELLLFENCGFDIRTLSAEKYAHVASILGSTPYKGTAVIADIVSYNIKSLWLTGFDCMHSLDWHRGWNEPQYDKCSRNDFKFIRNLWSEHAWIEVSPKLKKLFEAVPE